MLDFTSCQPRTKNEALRLAIWLRNEGRLFRRDNLELEDFFKGSIDRFCQITVQLGLAKRVLDEGARQGLPLSLLRVLGDDSLQRHVVLISSDTTASSPKDELELLLHPSGFKT